MMSSINIPTSPGSTLTTKPTCRTVPIATPKSQVMGVQRLMVGTVGMLHTATAVVGGKLLSEYITKAMRLAARITLVRTHADTCLYPAQSTSAPRFADIAKPVVYPAPIVVF